MTRSNRILLGTVVAVAVIILVILLLSWANGRMAQQQTDSVEVAVEVVVEDTVVAVSLCDEMLLMAPQDEAAAEVVNERPSGPVEGVTLYHDSPEGRMAVPRAATGDTMNYWVWTLPERHELPEGAQGEYWIECSWEGGEFTRSQRLPDDARVCKVGLDRDSAAAGYYAIRGVACR